MDSKACVYPDWLRKLVQGKPYKKTLVNPDLVNLFKLDHRVLVERESSSPICFPSLAKTVANMANKNLWERRNNQGVVIAKQERSAIERETRRNNDRLQIECMVNSGDLLETKFYLIDFQLLVKIEVLDQEPKFYPIEIGLIEWSMRHGIGNTLERLVNPGDIPLGYRSVAAEYSREYHRIPIDHNQYKLLGTSDYCALRRDIQQFVNPNKSSNTGYQALYCARKESQKVEGCLEWLYRASGAVSSPLPVYSLEDLTLALYKHRGVVVLEQGVVEMLHNSRYQYLKESRCTYHADIETMHCALAVPRRHSYALSNAMMSHYGFVVTDRHIPVVAPSNSVVLHGFGK